MSEMFILIVDDKQQNLFALEAILKDVPAKIIKANSGDEALVLTLNYDFALAILDVQMPEMDGYELASYLLDDSNTSRIPIIFLSAAYSDEQHAFKGYEQGAVDYIVKPFEPAILLRKVNVFLELARYRIQLEQLVQERTYAYQEEERKLRTIVENTSDYIFNIDCDGLITFVNAPKNHKNLIGGSIFELLEEQDVNLQKKALNDVYSNRNKAKFNSVMNLPWQTESVDYSHHLSPVIVDNQVVGCVQISRDINDIKLAQLACAEKVRAEAENKAKSKFLASMSHEIRTPMNAILGYTQLLKREQNLTPNQYRYLETIDSSGQHLLALIESVLDMARIESGRMTLQPTKLNLTQLIQEITRMFQLNANKKGIGLSFSESPVTPEWIFADANKIRQVVINLVGNALKFTEQGMIKIDTGLSATTGEFIRVYITVEDSGCGIEDDKIQTIFEPFEQANVGAGQVGVGLGLAVSREIARLMNGSISVVSKINCGSSFRFEFNATLSDEPSIKASEDVVWVAINETKARILVVDDDHDNLNMIGNILVSAGLQVILADSGSEGLRMFEKHKPQLVILDYQMEPVSGLDVVQGIRNLTDAELTPIIMITASPSDEYRQQSLDVGANAFLAKPFREQDLFCAIQKVTSIEFEKTVINENLVVNKPRTRLPLTNSEIAKLPELLRMNLQNAVRTGYLEEIYMAIDAIENENPEIGIEMRELADNYRYMKLLSFFEVKEVVNA